MPYPWINRPRGAPAGVTRHVTSRESRPSRDGGVVFGDPRCRFDAAPVRAVGSLDDGAAAAAAPVRAVGRHSMTALRQMGGQSRPFGVVSV